MKNMKKSVAIVGALLLPILALAKPTDVKPHYDIPLEFWKYLHVDSLPVKNPKNIRTYTEIVPVYDTDLEDESGEITTYNYNKSGILTGGCYEAGDAVGGYKFTVEMNQYGHPAKIIWTNSALCQDCSDKHLAEHTYVTEYVPLYQTPGRIQQIRATTTNVGGKKVNSVNKFLVTPGPTGAPKKLICLEDNSIFLSFDSTGDTGSYNIYVFEAGYPDSFWELITLKPGESQVYNDNSDQSHSNETIETDSHGNWIKKTWEVTYDEGKYKEGLFRKISYY